MSHESHTEFNFRNKIKTIQSSLNTHAGKLIISDAKRLTVWNMNAQTIPEINSNLNKLGNVELVFFALLLPLDFQLVNATL
jgi:hypothetical protein